jgi:hypothetical protein
MDPQPEGKKQKPVISAEKALNWYYGNFLMSPNNALRDTEGYEDEMLKTVEELRKELRGARMTHKQFLDLMKEKGIHGKFYHYKRYETDCPLCRMCGIR